MNIRRAQVFIDAVRWAENHPLLSFDSEVTSQMFLGKFREICGEEIAAQLNWEGRAAA